MCGSFFSCFDYTTSCLWRVKGILGMQDVLESHCIVLTFKYIYEYTLLRYDHDEAFELVFLLEGVLCRFLRSCEFCLPG
jgi:hypothetical protein